MDTTSVEQKLITSAGDPFVYAAPALADMLPSDRERIVRAHYAVEYRQALRRLMAMGITDGEDEEE